MEERIVNSVSDLVTQIVSLERRDDKVIFYRGHFDSAHTNCPGVLRNENLRLNEDVMLREIISLHPDEFQTDKTALEQLVRAQHYGLPTRLLDITLNPLAALFFACDGPQDKDGEVVVLFVDGSRVKRYDSDTVSCLANLAFLSGAEKEDTNKHLNQIKTTSKTDRQRKNREFRNTRSIKRLHHFICQEKPYFKNEIKPITFRQFVAVLPKRANRRIVAQSGAFVVFGCLNVLRSNSSKYFSIQKFTVPHNKKSEMLDHLDKLGINERTMYPEIDRSANFIRQQYAN